MSKNVLPLNRVSSERFKVSSLTFRSLIHFEFIFVYDVMKCSNFILLYIAIQFSHVLETVFSPLYILSCLIKDKVPIDVWINLWAF